VRNAYDNSILYTDYVLHGLITRLERLSDRYDTAMLYVSDHGESLGEGGVFLHGLPYAIAPAAQTHVPLVFWMSTAFAGEFAVDRPCLAGEAGKAYSHDNLFHSVIGLLDIDTTAYQPTLDMFARCQRRSA
jgi:lipid A ethanolaminephosphotransferase